MTEHQSRAFQYIKLENNRDRYFCVQQSIAVVAWILYFQKDALRPIIRNGQTTFSFMAGVRRLRNQFALVRKNARILLHFAMYRLKLSGAYPVLELPCYGQFCVPVHKGNKIFDLRKKVVIKVFDHDLHPDVILGEIELLQHISKIDFAPSIREWNIEKRWYEEDYLGGSLDSSYKPMDSKTLLVKFKADVVHQLMALLLFQETKYTNVVAHLTFIAKILNFSRLSKQESTISDFKRVEKFIESIIHQLRKEEDCPILLVYTHGDFVPANMLNTLHGLKLIDWEGAGYRSTFFDFYSYFFYRTANRSIPVHELYSEIQEALALFLTELRKNSQEIFLKVERVEKIYRWTFYVEMLCRLIEREMSDNNLNVLDTLSRYLEAFTRYEEMLEVRSSRH